MNQAGAARRSARLAPLITVAVVLAITLGVQSTQPAGTFWDDGVYLISARSLALGQGYRFAHLPGAPAAVHYPPGWPAVLALVWRLSPGFPDNIAALQFVNPVLAAVAAGLACAFGVRSLRLAPALAAGATVVFATALPVLVLDSVLFAEPLFLLVIVCALVAADAAVRDGGAARAVAAGTTVGGAMLVRSAGIAMLPAVIVALLAARRVREALAAGAACLAVVLPWQWWVWSHTGELTPALQGSYGPYLPWLATAVRERGAAFVVAIVRRNTMALERTFAVTFFPVGLHAVRPLLVVMLLVLVLLGAHAAWRRSRVFCLFAGAYALLVICWPYAPDRFVWGVWPLAGILAAAGTADSWRHARAAGSPPGVRLAAGALMVVAATAGAGLAFYSARGVLRGWVDIAQRQNAAQLQPVADWVNRHTSPADVVACDGEPFVHLHTGRRVMPVHELTADEYVAGTPLGTAADGLRDLLVAGGARYAVFSAGAAELQAAAELINASGGSLRLVPLDTLPGGGMAFRIDRLSGTSARGGTPPQPQRSRLP